MLSRDVVLWSSGGAAPLVKILEDFWGFSPPSNAKLLNIFLKFSYSSVDLQTYINICS